MADPDLPRSMPERDELTPDEFAVMTQLVLLQRGEPERLAPSIDPPATLDETLQALIDRGFVKEVVEGGEPTTYAATIDGREVYLAQMTELGRLISDAE